MKIAIQGGKASFHDEAVQAYFGENSHELLECPTFRGLSNSLKNGEVDLAVMAVENTLAGSILPNYGLIEEYSFNIIGEVYLRIEQNLMALPGQNLEDISTVRSHPMALNQCSKYLEEQPQMRGIETFDTAESAREIREFNLNKTAAIASRRAAEIYGLEILAESIENVKQNYTRFLVLSTKNNYQLDGINKTSINFKVQHKPGALFGVLNLFQEYNLNMSLIQSIPIPGYPNEYAFHIDFVWRDRDVCERAIDVLKSKTQDFKLLGMYKAGKIPYED